MCLLFFHQKKTCIKFTLNAIKYFRVLLSQLCIFKIEMSALLRSQKVIHGFINSQHSMQRKCFFFFCNRNLIGQFHYITWIYHHLSFPKKNLIIGKLLENAVFIGVFVQCVYFLPIRVSIIYDCMWVWFYVINIWCPVKFARCQQRKRFFSDNNLAMC